MIEPTIATPTDAPAKRLTKLSDDPSPAFAAGRSFITTVDGGAINNDRPTPKISEATIVSHNGSVRAIAKAPEATAVTTSPSGIVFRGPSSARTCWARNEHAPKMTANGTKSRPTVTIGWLCTSCRYCGFRKRNELSNRYAITSVIDPVATAGRSRIRTSKSGALTRSARPTNRASAAAPMTSAAITSGDVQPRFGPSMIPNSKTPSPTTDRIAPSMSRRGRPPSGTGAFDSGRVLAPSTTPTATIGTLTRNTEPHQKWSSSSPPAIGPTASPVAPNTANAAIARPRSSGRYIDAMIASAGAVTPAAPSPITARKAISSPVDELKAAANEAIAKRV